MEYPEFGGFEAADTDTDEVNPLTPVSRLVGSDSGTLAPVPAYAGEEALIVILNEITNRIECFVLVLLLRLQPVKQIFVHFVHDWETFRGFC